MSYTGINCEGIFARDESTGDPAIGQTLWLLPDGGSAPGDLIPLTENSYVSGRYMFPSQITNGLYDLYEGSAGSQTPVQHGGTTEQVRVMRDGMVEESDMSIAKDW